MTFEGREYSTQRLQLDYEHHRVQIDGKIVPKPLSAKAFRLLDFLVTHAGKVCPREKTSEAVYNEKYVPRRDNARLDALVERTRARIGDDQRNPRFIETVRGIGHRLKVYSQEAVAQQTTTDTRSLQPCAAGTIHE
jgi:two-component system, OmpR family, alkaline phosphatase synthesis response regulator PhoP